MKRRSNDRLPARFVLALPERHGCLIVEDLAIFWAAFEHLLRPVGDIAEMTEQRAPVPFLDLALRPKWSPLRIAAMKWAV